MEKPNFKIYKDCDTPSGDADLLNNKDLSQVFNSTEMDQASTREIPAPYLSAIAASVPSLENIEPQDKSKSSLVLNTSSGVMNSTNGIEWDLCGIQVKGQGYLAQHRGKKKCLEKQRTKEKIQLQLEASAARMESLRLSESGTDIDASKVSDFALYT